MARLSPGCYILYSPSGFNAPPWPGILYCDDMAPSSISQTRPAGYYTLVLLLGEGHREFHWAMTGQIKPFEPLLDLESTESRPGLKQAYQEADFALDAGLGMDYWSAMLEGLDEQAQANSRSVLVESAVEPQVIQSRIQSQEARFDEDMELAMKLSLEARVPDDRKRAAGVTLSSPSRTPKRTKDATNARCSATSPKIPNYFPLSRCFSSPTAGPSRTKRTSNSKAPYDKQPDSGMSPETGERPLPASSRVLLRDLGSDQSRAENEYDAADQNTSSSQQYCRSESNVMIRSSETKDVDIADDNVLVEFLIGPTEERFMIKKSAIDGRPYFTNPHFNFLNPKGEHGWSFNRPCLREISPDDFSIVAEYLYDDDFGHREVNTESQRADVFTACATAWDVADKLCMEELLEHIVVKIELAKPWALEETLAFASLVYCMKGGPLPPYEQVKGKISDFISENWFEYLENHVAVFAARLRRFPELEADVLKKRLAVLKREGVTGADVARSRRSDSVQT